MKKSPAFYLTLVATVLAVLALVFYQSNSIKRGYVTVLAICAIVFGLVYLALYGKLGDKHWFGYVLTLAAVASIGAVGYSLVNEVEAIGYLMSGLRQWSDIQMWAYFAICGILAWLLLLVASFMKSGERKA